MPGLVWIAYIEWFQILIALSLGFGIFTQLVFWRSTRWVGLIASVVAFAVGVVISEVWFGWATAAELQPNIDGLSFDEVLIGYLIGIPAVLVARYLTGRSQAQRPVSG